MCSFLSEPVKGIVQCSVSIVLSMTPTRSLTRTEGPNCSGENKGPVYDRRIVMCFLYSGSGTKVSTISDHLCTSYCLGDLFSKKELVREVGKQLCRKYFWTLLSQVHK